MSFSTTGKIRWGGGNLIGMGRIQFSHKYEEVISVENLLEAWKEFKRGKGKKEGVQRFQLQLMEYILALHTDCATKHIGTGTISISGFPTLNRAIFIKQAFATDCSTTRSIGHSIRSLTAHSFRIPTRVVWEKVRIAP